MTQAMSAEDWLAVIDVIADYAFRLDSGDLDGYMANFARDAVLESRSGRVQGWDAIRAYVSHLIEIGQVGGDPARLRHFIGLPLVHGDGDRCHANAYVMISGLGENGRITIPLVGEYDLDLMKRDGRWLFTRRATRMDLVGPGRLPGDEGEPGRVSAFSAPVSAPAVGSMGAADRLAVIDLIADYAFRLDSGDVEGYIENFTPDGAFDGVAGVLQGREAIRDYVASLVERQRTSGARTCHVIGIPRVRGDGERTQAETYVVILTRDGEKRLYIRYVGLYTDHIVKTDGRWRFERRQVRMHLVSS